MRLQTSGSKYEKNSLLFSCVCAPRKHMRTTKFISLFKWLVHISDRSLECGDMNYDILKFNQ